MRNTGSNFLLPALVMAALAPAQAEGGPPTDVKSLREYVDAKLASHPFFTKITVKVVDQYPPFLFYLQRPPRDLPDYERRIINSYLPFLRELEKQCRQEYWQPGGFVEAGVQPGFAVAILDSEGSYLNFRTAIGAPGLEQARAHYTPDLRLAVSYVDAFKPYDTGPEERHALLHEFVHALQHAYAPTGKMPKPAWYNEGLADYRASSTNIAKSLVRPPLQDRHVRSLAFGYGNPAGKFYVAPIADLVAANSYQDVIDFATKRNSAKLRSDVILPMFYSQSEMFVRFLHEANGGKRQAQFLQYLAAAQKGESGLETFRKAFECATEEQLAALDREWLTWLDGVLQEAFPGLRSLAAVAEAAAGKAVSVPLPPPAKLDKSGLAFAPGDIAARIAAVRALCVEGRLQAALALLPAADAKPDPAATTFPTRVRARIESAIELRDKVLNRLAVKQSVISLDGRKGRVKPGKDGPEIHVVGGKNQLLPLHVMMPGHLVREGNRAKAFSGKLWLQVWLRWLKGDKRSKLKRFLGRKDPAMVALNKDLTGDYDAANAAGAFALAELQGLPETDDPAAAREALATLRQQVKEHGKHPLLTARKEAINGMVRAYAERAFDPGRMADLGITGKITELGDGRVRIAYPNKESATDFDFTLVSDPSSSPFPMPETGIAYDGPASLSGNPYNLEEPRKLIGSGQLVWGVPLTGAHAVEFEFVMRNAGDWGVHVCVDKDGYLMVAPDGQVVILDRVARISDVVGKVKQMFLEKPYKMRIEYDGKQTLLVKQNGVQVARVSKVGSRVRGELRFYVHSSNAVEISNLVVEGTPNVVLAEPLRERFVQRALNGLWQ